MERSSRAAAAPHKLPAPLSGSRQIHLEQPWSGADIGPEVVCTDLSTSGKVGLEAAAQAGRIATVSLFLPPSPLLLLAHRNAHEDRTLQHCEICYSTCYRTLAYVMARPLLQD